MNDEYIFSNSEFIEEEIGFAYNFIQNDKKYKYYYNNKLLPITKIMFDDFSLIGKRNIYWSINLEFSNRRIENICATFIASTTMNSIIHHHLETDKGDKILITEQDI